MLTYWEILTGIQSNAPVNDSYAQLWGKKSQNNYTIVTYTGTLPATLTGTKAGYLHRYKIYGNTEQIGIPTPENPIVPQECGELETTGAHAGQYKLPLTSAGQNANIYLGESQTTRWIKKLVLTGEEPWGINASVSTEDTVYVFSSVIAADTFVANYSICSHFVYKNIFDIRDENGFHLVPGNNGLRIRIMRTIAETRDDFKAFLAAQYANGTPVTVWYVLAEPETSTLNEPLRKIGNYADTIDSTQTSAQIPTTANSTTISWAGEGLAPSQVDLGYEKKR